MSHLDDAKAASVSSNSQFVRNNKLFLLAIAGITLVFIIPLAKLIQLSLNTELYSHILLIPIVSLYFAWDKRNQKSFNNSKLNRSNGLTTVLILLAITSASTAFILENAGQLVSIDDRLAITLLPYVLLIAAAGSHFLGVNAIKTHLFSFAFLVFLLPMPLFLQHWINTFFQYTSAETSYQFIKAIQIPIYRDHPLSFELPTISLQVAPECSGIRSSLVLFITSIVAGELFLRSKWKRLLLIVFVIPLAIFRNGLRIVTIAYLCVEYGPHMIDSWVHRQGGPLFFLVSLAPFFAVLLFLWRLEKRKLPSS